MNYCKDCKYHRDIGQLYECMSPEVTKLDPIYKIRLVKPCECIRNYSDDNYYECKYYNPSLITTIKKLF